MTTDEEMERIADEIEKDREWWTGFQDRCQTTFYSGIYDPQFNFTFDVFQSRIQRMRELLIRAVKTVELEQQLELDALVELYALEPGVIVQDVIGTDGPVCRSVPRNNPSTTTRLPEELL